VFTFYVPGRSGGHIVTAQYTVFSSQVPIRIDITLIHPSIEQRIFESTIFDIASLSSPGRDNRSTHIYIRKTPHRGVIIIGQLHQPRVNLNGRKGEYNVKPAYPHEGVIHVGDISVT